MELALLAARLVLAAVFAAAGIAKLRDREGSRASLVGFGLPERLARPGAVVLPLVELAVALALLPASTSRLGAAGALALLAVFVLAISFNLARGRAPDCNCFGSLHSEPVGVRTIARNGILAVAAGTVAVGGPGTSATGWLGTLEGVEVGLAVLATALGLLALTGTWAVSQLLRQNGRLLLRLDELEAALTSAGIELDAGEPEFPEGLAIGSEAPGFSLPALAGPDVSLADLLREGSPTLLVFSDAGCGPCDDLLPDVARWQREHSAITVAVVSSGDPEVSRAKAEAHGLDVALLDEAGAVGPSFEAYGTPTAVLVDRGGRVASGIASGSAGVEALLDLALRERDLSLPRGASLPSLTLPALDGEEHTLRELIDAQTVVLFWNPDCGFCQELRPDLLAWEAGRPAWAPALVVVSGGGEQATRSEGFASPVLLDDRSHAADAFGAAGTPMAVLVDADGTIASELAVGAEAVLALVDAEPAVRI